MRYRFDTIATGTHVTVRRGGVAGRSEAAEEHARGWERVLDWLAVHMKRGANLRRCPVTYPSNVKGYNFQTKERHHDRIYVSVSWQTDTLVP